MIKYSSETWNANYVVSSSTLPPTNLGSSSVDRSTSIPSSILDSSALRTSTKTHRSHLAALVSFLFFFYSLLVSSKWVI